MKIASLNQLPIYMFTAVFINLQFSLPFPVGQNRKYQNLNLQRCRVIKDLSVHRQGNKSLTIVTP